MTEAPRDEPLEVPPEASGQRIDRFLRKRFPRLPASLAQKLLRTRRVRVDGKRVGASHRLTAGERVEVHADLSDFEARGDEHLRWAARRRRSEDFRRWFRVLHEDESVIALDKPAGIVVHPGPGHHGGDTLLDLLAAHLPGLFAPDSEFRPAFVHRLDRGTSGVLLAAKTRHAANRLERAFREGATKKLYRAVVRGTPRSRAARIEHDVRVDERVSRSRRYRAVSPKRDAGDAEETRGRSASTSYRIVESLGTASLVEVAIDTGRTHQIRVHLAHEGHPIAGDGDYGDRRWNRWLREEHGLRRLFLHAAELEVPHPESGEALRLRSPLPPELTRAWRSLGERRGVSDESADSRRSRSPDEPQRGPGQPGRAGRHESGRRDREPPAGGRPAPGR